MLKLKRFNKGVWFNVPDFPGVRVKVRAASHKKTTEILRKHKAKVGVGDQIVDDFDEAAVALELFKYILEDFEGIECEEELSKDEIKEIIYEYDKLRDFISEKSAELREKIQGEFDKDLKNSKNSQGG